MELRIVEKMRYILSDGQWRQSPVAYVMGIPVDGRAIAYNGDDVSSRLTDYYELTVGTNGETIAPCPWPNTRVRVRTVTESWEITVIPNLNVMYPGSSHAVQTFP